MPHIDTVEPSWPFKPEEAIPVKGPDWDNYQLDQKIDETCNALAQFGRRTDRLIDRSFFWLAFTVFNLWHWLYFIGSFPIEYFPSVQVIHLLVVAGAGAYAIRRSKKLYQQLQAHQVQRALRTSLLKLRTSNTPDTPADLPAPQPNIIYSVDAAHGASETIRSPEDLLEFAWNNILRSDESKLRTYTASAAGSAS